VQAESRSAPGTPPLRYWLIWETRQVPLSEGDNIIGRAPDVSVWIEASGVSRRHACIRLDGARATLEDLASKNGTYLRGVRVTDRVPLADGDQIRLGSVLMTFRVPPPAGSTSTAGEKR
jgi:pSer/pThr/pTyr-binding forkhead associated (FHA) protein